MIYVWVLTLTSCLGVQTLFADMVAGHALGVSYASSQLGAVQGKAQSTSTADIPGFKTATPSEASLDNGSIGDAAVKAAHNNEASTYISQHARERQSFKIDPNTDPMLVNANKATANPEKTMDEVVLETPGDKGDDEIVFCEEGGDEYIQKCQKIRIIALKITPSTVRSEPCCGGHETATGGGRGDPGNRAHYSGCHCSSRLVGQPKKVEVETEEWLDGCKVLEDLADSGLCRYVTIEQDGEATKTIQGEPISRDSWEKHYTYACFKKVAGDCHKLSAKGCIQVASTCSEKIAGVCVAWKQTYRCPSAKQKQVRYKSVGDKTPFCLTGDCANADYEANGELADAMTNLAILKEAQDDVRTNLGIFKGQIRHCRKDVKGFRDCCGSGNSWGVQWHLAAGCEASEKELGDWRNKKRCVYVGTYCAKKWPIIGCVEKKSGFCCFGTKLSKLIQEQGRRQLGMGWGDPESPNCRGLSPEELSRLDMSKMDLSELYAEVSANFKPQTQSHVAKGLELDRIRENMKHLASKPKILEGQKL